MKHTRRNFVKSSAASLTIPAVFSSLSAARSTSPNERPAIALVGCGGRGTGDGKTSIKFGDLIAVCDVDTSHSANAKNLLQKSQAGAIDVHGDYRAIIDRKDIDVVICGTVDHWHVKVSAEALKSGKDVYCEKPLTLTIDEGRIISKVNDETGRILQVGTQQRSDHRFLKAVYMAHSGRLGKLRKVTVGINQNPFSKKLPTVAPPKTLNWDKWKGPTEDVPYRFLSEGKAGQQLVRNLGDGGIDASNCHKEFRWWLEYSGGKMTDWGAHHVDIAQWIIGQTAPGQGPTLISPKMVEAKVPFDKNGNPTRSDQYNAPHRFTVEALFPNDVVMEITSEGRNGILVEGDKGRIFVNRGTIAGKPIEDLSSDPLPGNWLETVYGAPQLVSHMQNFFDCVRDRAKPVSDVWSHVTGLNTCHLSNIAIRLNRQIKWDSKTQKILGDAQAERMQARDFRKGYEIEV